MPPQTEREFFNFSKAGETENVGKVPLMVTSKRQRRQSMMRSLSSLIFSLMFRVLNINWFLGFFGLVLVKLEENDDVSINKRKNEDLIENEMKRLKSEANGQDDENQMEDRLLTVRSSLIQDFKKKLWNLTPVINFSKDTEDVDETFENSPKKVITPTRSFDNLLELSEAESFAGDHNELEELETGHEEEVGQVTSYTAEATYHRVERAVCTVSEEQVEESQEPQAAEVTEQEMVGKSLGTEKMEPAVLVDEAKDVSIENLNLSKGSVELATEIVEDSFDDKSILREKEEIKVNSQTKIDVKDDDATDRGAEAKNMDADISTEESVGIFKRNSLGRGKSDNGKKKKKKNSKAYKVL